MIDRREEELASLAMLMLLQAAVIVLVGLTTPWSVGTAYGCVAWRLLSRALDHVLDDDGR